ncbi:MAG TPA: PKD domain-containing protein [Thermoanaerobaculia bacterium]
MSKRTRLRAASVISFLLLLAATNLLGQEVIVNGSFNTNLNGWGLDPGVGTVQWSSDGTLLLTNDGAPPNQTASASQCDAISGGFFYNVSARMEPINFVGSPNSSSGLKRVEHTGSLYVLLDFFPLDNCRGSALPQFVRLSAAGATDGKFITVSEPFLSPGQAVSVLVSLAILKDQAGDNLQAEFDDISLSTSSTPPPPPVANFTYLPSNPSIGQSVGFTDASSGADFWAWDFGDPASGGFNTSSIRNPTHVYNAMGTYTVTLKVTNATASDSKSATVAVSPPPPTAEFTFSPSAPGPGVTVQFTDASNGAPTSWSWTFGDPTSGSANTSTQQNPTHVFGAVGVYTVTLAAKSASGTGLRNHAVTVAVAPLAVSFAFTPEEPTAGRSVHFTDTSSGGPTNWSWNFGDPNSGAANSSDLQNPSHTFSRAGVYSVTLTATNPMGTGTQTTQVTVKCLRCPRVIQFR